jgi:hypothetical protein
LEDWLYAEGWDPEGLKKECTGFETSKVMVNQTENHLHHSFNNPLNSSSNHHLNPSVHSRSRLRKIRNLDNSVAAHDRGRRLAVTASGNRAMVFLVETSDLKKPRQESLGGSTNVNFFFFVVSLFILCFL